MDANGMVILHDDFIKHPEKERMSQQHIVIRVRESFLSTQNY